MYVYSFCMSFIECKLPIEMGVCECASGYEQSLQTAHTYCAVCASSSAHTHTHSRKLHVLFRFSVVYTDMCICESVCVHSILSWSLKLIKRTRDTKGAKEKCHKHIKQSQHFMSSSTESHIYTPRCESEGVDVYMGWTLILICLHVNVVYKIQCWMSRMKGQKRIKMEIGDGGENCWKKCNDGCVCICRDLNESTNFSPENDSMSKQFAYVRFKYWVLKKVSDTVQFKI